MDENDHLDAAVGSLIEIGGLLSQVVTHMAESPRRTGPGGQLVAPIPRCCSRCSRTRCD